MHLHLKDHTRNVDIIQEELNLDFMSEDFHDKLMKGVVHGKHGVAYVYYTVFRLSVLATIEVTITKEDDGGSGPSMDVYGGLVAAYGNSERYCSNIEETKYLATTLFGKESNQIVSVKSKTSIELSRYVVAIPAYASLTFKADLWDSSGQVVCGSREFLAKGWGLTEGVIEGQNVSVQVRVIWNHAYLKLYKDAMEVDSKKESEESRGEQSNKKARVRKQHYGYHMVEVFSIVVGGTTREIFALSGTIEFDEKFIIFKREESAPEVLSGNYFVPLEAHSGFRNCEFDMKLCLKDPDQGLEVSRGRVGWNISLLESESTNMSYFNKRLCSVVQGEHGFAAVHYMIFDLAFYANVTVAILSTSSDSPIDVPLSMYGKVWAYYSTHEYSTNYERQCYRTGLFDKSREKSVEIIDASAFPLSRSVVHVPSDTSVIIEADLFKVGNLQDEHVSGKVEFEIDLSFEARKVCREFQAGCYRVQVSLEWKYPVFG